jgi:predicted MFS family arabinose efflux permease
VCCVRIGGILTNYFGWRYENINMIPYWFFIHSCKCIRSIFWFLAIFASTIWLTLVFFLPETLRKLVGDGSGYANPTPYQYWKRRDIETPSKNNEPKRKIPIHPFRSFANLKEKDVFVVLAYMAFQYSGQYTVLTSLTDLFSDIYKLDSLQLGLCFLPHGIGAIIGSYISGLVLNWSFKRISKSLGLDSSQVKK